MRAVVALAVFLPFANATLNGLVQRAAHFCSLAFTLLTLMPRPKGLRSRRCSVRPLARHEKPSLEPVLERRIVWTSSVVSEVEAACHRCSCISRESSSRSRGA